MGWYDYGARMYDPNIGRWNGVDPHAEKYQSWSTYNFVYNNPLKYDDPSGEDGRLTIKGFNITLSTTVHVHGSHATQTRVDQMQTRFDDLDNEKTVLGFFKVRIEVTYRLSTEINSDQQAQKYRSPRSGIIYANTLTKETKEKIGFQDGDNLLEIEAPNNQTLHGIAGQGSTGGRVKDNAIQSAHHEVMHELGFDERYERVDLENGVVVPETHKGFDLDIMSDQAPLLIHPLHFMNIYTLAAHKLLMKNNKQITTETDAVFILKNEKIDDTNDGKTQTTLPMQRN